MHQVEKLQSYFRVTPEKPELHETYFPLPDGMDKYVLIFNDEATQAHTYDFFTDVIEYLLDIDPSLKFVQVANVNNPNRIANTYTVEGISHSQLFFLVKHCQVAICTDSFTPELCGIYDKPMICLAGNRFAANANPWFYNQEIHMSLCPVEQPSFFGVEDEKAINKILPEDVARPVLEQLNIEDSIPSCKTEFVGNAYRKYFVDYIPDFEITNTNSVNYPLNIRLDLCDNIENSISAAQILPIQSIISDKEFKIEGFIPVRNNINSVIIEVDLDTDINFIKKLNELGSQIILRTKDKENLPEIRLKFIDWKVDYVGKPERPINIKEDKNYFYKSTKLTLSNDKKFTSLAAKLENAKTNLLLDTDEFWEESDHFLIYSVDK